MPVWYSILYFLFQLLKNADVRQIVSKHCFQEIFRKLPTFRDTPKKWFWILITIFSSEIDSIWKWWAFSNSHHFCCRKTKIETKKRKVYPKHWSLGDWSIYLKLQNLPLYADWFDVLYLHFLDIFVVVRSCLCLPVRKALFGERKESRHVQTKFVLRV